MKVIFSTTDPSEASVLSALLGREGIASKIDNEGSAYYAVGMPTSAALLNITVQEEDAEAATRIIQASLQKRAQGARATEPAGAFEKSVECHRRRWQWMLIAGYGLPIFIILGVGMFVGGRKVIESPAWMMGALIIALLAGTMLWANRKRGTRR